MSKKKNYRVGKYLHVISGDKIEIFFNHSNTRIIAIVKSVVDRHGRVNNGKDKILPLVRYNPLTIQKDGVFIDDYSYEENACDISYVKAILERGGKMPTPLKRGFLYLPNDSLFIDPNDKKHGIILSTFNSMLLWAWVRVIGQTTYLDSNKAWHEFIKHRYPGVTRRYENDFSHSLNIFYFRKKSFLKWVSRNCNKMLKKHSIIEEEETRFNNEMEQDYWEDLYNMMK